MQNSQSVTITLTPEEQSILLDALHFIDMPRPSLLRALYLKFVFLFQKSGDLCLHSEQSPDAVVQGDSICYQCEKRVSHLFDDSRCKDCTRLTPEEVQGNVGQENNQ